MAFFIEDPFVDKVQWGMRCSLTLSCMKMGLIHDLAESLVGDITPVDNVTVEDKHAMEKVEMDGVGHGVERVPEDCDRFPQPLADERWVCGGVRGSAVDHVSLRLRL